MSKKKIEATLNEKDLELVKGIVVEVVEPMKKDIEFLKAQLSGDNAPHKDDEVPENNSTATKDTVQRRRISTTKRIDGDAFSKVYALVKKYNGRIVHKDENGKALSKDRAHWTFSLSDGKAFADEVDKTKVAIFGKGTKTVPMKSTTYTVSR